MAMIMVFMLKSFKKFFPVQTRFNIQFIFLLQVHKLVENPHGGYRSSLYSVLGCLLKTDGYLLVRYSLRQHRTLAMM
jgi:hypothetical protein